MTLPNFIVLGAAKAGTTALYHYLGQHPEVYVSPLKETNFFALEGSDIKFTGPGDDEWVNRVSIRNFEDYRDQFARAQDETAIGEVSPLYLYDTRAVERISRYVSSAKLVVIIRNPADRAFSAFLHMIRDGREPIADFSRALDAEDERIAAGWEHIWHYKRMGLYYEQLKRYYDVFPEKQIKVFVYQELRREPNRVMSEMFRFLGVDDTFKPDISQRHNTAPMDLTSKPVMTNQIRADLQDYFEQDILKLEQLLGCDLSHWLQREASKQEAQLAVSAGV